MPKKEAISQCLTCPIRHLSIFAGLTTVQIKAIALPIVKMTYYSGEVFYREGGKIQSAFTINDGVVKLVRSLPNGRNQIVRLLTVGDIFGFEGMIEHRYHHTAVAISRTLVCRLSLPELNLLSRDHDSVREALTQRWATALRQAEQLVLEMGSKKAAERLATFLLHWCRHTKTDGDKTDGDKTDGDKTDGDKTDGDWTELPLTRQELGELLGLTVETVSRFLAEWKRLALIEEQAGNLRILDLDQLQARADGIR